MNNGANLKLAVFFTIGADVSMLESRTYTGRVYLSSLWKHVPEFGVSKPSTPVLAFGDLVL